MSGDNYSSTIEKKQYVGGSRVSVLLPLPLTITYDYRVPDDMSLCNGSLVDVPLGNRIARGVVWGEGNRHNIDLKLKKVIELLEFPPLPESCLEFIKWVSNYSMTHLGLVLRMVISVPDAMNKPNPIIAYNLVDNPPPFRETAARNRVINVLCGGPPCMPPELAKKAKVSTSVAKGLLKVGVLKVIKIEAPLPPLPDPDTVGPKLSLDQKEAALRLVTAVKKRLFSVHVLDGVPGSGKTEVYFEAIAEALRQGKQALVLLPEIALGTQWRKRFRDRFGVTPTEWHSDVTHARRRDIWRQVAHGQTPVVVGARSALYLPFPNLGLIVADEEHDTAYKQEDGVIYNARDMAVVRARICKIPVILASATPSLETFVNASKGRYHLLRLPERHGGSILPKVDIIDMKTEKLPSTRWISGTLQKALINVIEQGQQALLYLNRRGYAPLTLCRACGFRLKCSNCTAWLVEHRLSGTLRCHHCGYTLSIPEKCPECKGEETFAACGPGVERLAEEVTSLFPNIRYVIASSDTLQNQRAAEKLIQSIENHCVDLIIGTQIISKGYHFPMLTLVGVVDADLGLSGGELRAAERTYQVLYQVAGRSGRGEIPGRVILQTYFPTHPVMEALATIDRDAFYAAEIQARETMGMPPFGRLVSLIISSQDETAVIRAAIALSRTAPHSSAIRVFGPAPAPIPLLRRRHRQRLLLKVHKDITVQPIIKKWISSTQLPKETRIQIDVDPYSFM